jgi:hypothetical protein
MKEREKELDQGRKQEDKNETGYERNKNGYIGKYERFGK